MSLCGIKQLINVDSSAVKLYVFVWLHYLFTVLSSKQTKKEQVDTKVCTIFHLFIIRTFIFSVLLHCTLHNTILCLSRKIFRDLSLLNSNRPLLLCKQHTNLFPVPTPSTYPPPQLLLRLPLRLFRPDSPPPAHLSFPIVTHPLIPIHPTTSPPHPHLYPPHFISSISTSTHPIHHQSPPCPQSLSPLNNLHGSIQLQASPACDANIISSWNETCKCATASPYPHWVPILVHFIRPGCTETLFYIYIFRQLSLTAED